MPQTASACWHSEDAFTSTHSWSQPEDRNVGADVASDVGWRVGSGSGSGIGVGMRVGSTGDCCGVGCVVGSGSGSGSGAAVGSPVGVGPPTKARVELLMKVPDAVSWPAAHDPVAGAPGLRAAHISCLSLIAQFASEMWCSARKSNQSCAEPRSSAPLPSALQVPHSVTKSATLFSRAALALLRRLSRCVFA